MGDTDNGQTPITMNFEVTKGASVVLDDGSELKPQKWDHVESCAGTFGL